MSVHSTHSVLCITHSRQCALHTYEEGGRGEGGKEGGRGREEGKETHKLTSLATYLPSLSLPLSPFSSTLYERKGRRRERANLGVPQTCTGRAIVSNKRHSHRK